MCMCAHGCRCSCRPDEGVRSLSWSYAWLWATPWVISPAHSLPLSWLSSNSSMFPGVRGFYKKLFTDEVSLSVLTFDIGLFPVHRGCGANPGDRNWSLERVPVCIASIPRLILTLQLLGLEPSNGWNACVGSIVRAYACVLPGVYNPLLGCSAKLWQEH